jgi:type I restriction enzyme S subunit
MVASFKIYRSYQGVEVAWLDSIPSEWTLAPIKYQYAVVGGSTPKSGEERYWDGDVVWVTPADLSKLSTKYVNDSIRSITTDGLGSCGASLVPKSSVIVSTRAPIGSLAIAASTLCTNQGCKALVPLANRGDCRYLYYWLLVNSEPLNVLGKGTTFLEISGDVLAGFEMPVPSYVEQETIANFLDHETAKIDTLIDKQQQLIKLLKEKRQAVISHAVTKGLNPDAPMKDSGVEWLGEVPEHWIVRRLKHTAKLQSGIPKGKDLTGKNSIEVPMLRVANVQDGYLSLADVHTMKIEPHELDRYQLQNGDVLMNEGGDNDKLGRGAVWRKELVPCIHQNHVFAIRPENIEPEWLDTLTRAAYAKFHFYCVAKQSTNLASISSTNIKETPLLIPPGAERAAILTYLTNQFERFDLLEDKANLQVKLLQERRTALISAAVTGKIDVRRWQPVQAEIPMEASA